MIQFGHKTKSSLKQTKYDENNINTDCVFKRDKRFAMQFTNSKNRKHENNQFKKRNHRRC